MAPNAKEGYGTCTIYAIEDLTSGEYVYTGSCAKPLYARWGQHLHDTYYKNSSNIQKHGPGISSPCPCWARSRAQTSAD